MLKPDLLRYELSNLVFALVFLLNSTMCQVVFFKYFAGKIDCLKVFPDLLAGGIFCLGKNIWQLVFLQGMR